MRELTLSEKDGILAAYRLLKKRDYMLALLMIRDEMITEELGLHKRAWMYEQQGCAYEEAVELLSQIFIEYDNRCFDKIWQDYTVILDGTQTEFDIFKAGFKAGFDHQKGWQNA